MTTVVSNAFALFVNAIAPADHIISLGTSTFDASSVQAGEIIEIAAGTRSGLRIDGLVNGTALNPIIIRNEPGAQVTINRTSTQTGDFLFRLKGGRYVIDGRTYAPAGESYGIKITRSTAQGAPTSFMQLLNDNPTNGWAEYITIKGVEVDGLSALSSQNPNNQAMIGIQHNEFDTGSSIYKLANYPGTVYHNVIVEHCYIHDTYGEGVYLGANYHSDGVYFDRPPTSGFEARYNIVEDMGRGFIELKLGWDGTNKIHHNICRRSGLRDNEPSGAQAVGCSFYEGGGEIYNNWIEDAGEHGAWTYVFKLPKSYLNSKGYSEQLTFRAYNNIIVTPGAGLSPGTNQPGNGVLAGDEGTSPLGEGQTAYYETSEAYNNTIISPENHGVSMGGQGSTKIAANNIICDVGGSYVSGATDTNNNKTSTVAAQFFENAGADDYRLTDNSPARDNASGTPLATTDYDDVVRGTPASQGAYE